LNIALAGAFNVAVRASLGVKATPYNRWVVGTSNLERTMRPTWRWRRLFCLDNHEVCSNAWTTSIGSNSAVRSRGVTQSTS